MSRERERERDRGPQLIMQKRVHTHTPLHAADQPDLVYREAQTHTEIHTPLSQCSNTNTHSSTGSSSSLLVPHCSSHSLSLVVITHSRASVHRRDGLWQSRRREACRRRKGGSRMEWHNEKRTISISQRQSQRWISVAQSDMYLSIINTLNWNTKMPCCSLLSKVLKGFSAWAPTQY